MGLGCVWRGGGETVENAVALESSKSVMLTRAYIKRFLNHRFLCAAAQG